MAKIDISKIEGFDAMTLKQKVEALQGFDFPDPDYSGWVRKETFIADLLLFGNSPLCGIRPWPFGKMPCFFPSFGV